MKVYGYNPCSGGICAKTWECLRRNEKFRALLKTQREAEGKERASSWEMAISREGNQFARIALGYILPTSYRRNRPVEAKPWFDENTPWPRTPKEFRVGLEEILTKSPKSPFVVDKPPFDVISIGGLLDFFPEREGYFHGWIQRAKRTWALYDVIAVPKFIRDTKHRDEILSAVRKIVRSTKRRDVYLKPGGRFLGSRTDWDAFLVSECWKKLGADTMTARGITACHLYDKEYFVRWSEAEILGSELAKKEATDLYVRRRVQTERYLSAIKSAIDSIYPIFAFVEEGLLPETGRPTANDFHSF